MFWLIALPQVNANELTNGVINAAFMLLFKDSIRLFAAYNEGIINLLGKTFKGYLLFQPSFCHVLILSHRFLVGLSKYFFFC